MLMKMVEILNFLLMLVVLPGQFQLINCVTAADMGAFLTNTFNDTTNGEYLTYVRPVIDQDHVVNVTADLFLIGINNFDSQEQKLTTTAYIEVRWKDEILARNWETVDVSEMYVPQNNVWLPDLALQNGFDTLVGLGDSFLFVQVKQDGSILWRPYQVLDSACEIDVAYFPFDKTTCELKFVIWSNTKDKVVIRTGTIGFNTNLYERNSEWDIREVRANDFISGNNSGILFTMELKRKPLQYLINILVPVIMLGVLNVFVFVLPSGSGEKTGFSVTAFLSFAVFLTIISTEMPQNSEKTSMFSMYLFIMTLVSTLMVVVTIVQLRIFNRSEDRNVSKYLATITKCVRKIRCVCCIGTGRVAGEKKPPEEAITWKSVADSLDFIGFWVFLLFMMIFTIVMVTVSVLSSEVAQ